MTGAALPAAPRRSEPSGWWGMVLFVATEATLFGALLGTYFTLRVRATHWPPVGIPDPRVAAPLLLTGLLVCSSVPMTIAARSASRGLLRPAGAALLAALAVQVVYAGLQAQLLVPDFSDVAPRETAYGSIYVTLAGAHLGHVALGLVLDAWLLLRLARGLTEYRAVGLRAAAFYWHAINVLAVVLVLVQVSPAL